MRKISKKQTNIELREHHGRLRNDLRLSPTDTTDYYVLANGNLILDFKDAPHSLLCNTEQEYHDFMTNVSQQGGYILGRFPGNEAGFMELVPRSKRKLEEMLDVALDGYSFDDLKRIDAALRKKKIGLDEYLKVYYPLLVPYVSQCVIEEKSAAWKFVINPEEHTAEPLIVLNDGREVHVFIDLYDEALENFKGFSVYETARLRV